MTETALARQTQQSVVAWCRLHYPGESLQQMIRNLMEEVGELAGEFDAEVEDLVAVLRKSMARGKEGTPEGKRGEFGDVLISVYNLADEAGIDAQSCLDEKMAKLSTRTVDESLARVKRKNELGLRNDIAHRLAGDTYLSVIDEEDHVIGRELRSVIHRDGLLHREVHVWILLPNGRLVLQRRASTKDTFPGYLDVSVGGHVEEGFTYIEAALTEILEETGLVVEARDLVHLATVRSTVQDTGRSVVNNARREVYLYRFGGNLSDLAIEPGDGAGFDAVRLTDMLDRKGDSMAEMVPPMFAADYEPVWDALKVWGAVTEFAKEGAR